MCIMATIFVCTVQSYVAVFDEIAWSVSEVDETPSQARQVWALDVGVQG